MVQASIIFFDKNAPKGSMPNKWSRYLIVESEAPWAGAEYTIASIIPVTDFAPMPSSKDFLSSNGMGSALKIAIDALKKQDQLIDFKFNISKR